MTWLPAVAAAGVVLITLVRATTLMRRHRRAIEAFDGDDLEVLKITVKDWQRPRITKRAARLGWMETGCRDEAGYRQLLLKRHDLDAAPLSELLRTLHKAGFWCEPVRTALNPREIDS